MKKGSEKNIKPVWLGD